MKTPTNIIVRISFLTHLAILTVRVETLSKHLITLSLRLASLAVSLYPVIVLLLNSLDGYKYTDCAYHTFDILQEFSNYNNMTDVTLESENYCGTLLTYFDSQHFLAESLALLNTTD